MDGLVGWGVFGVGQQPDVMATAVSPTSRHPCVSGQHSSGVPAAGARSQSYFYGQCGCSHFITCQDLRHRIRPKECRQGRRLWWQ